MNTNKTKSAFAPIKPKFLVPEEPKNEPAKEPKPVSALPIKNYTVAVTLKVLETLTKGEPVRVRSELVEGERTIAIALNRAHLIISRSLARADSLMIKFMSGLALAEYIGFWVARGTSDGASLRRAVAAFAKIEAEGFSGITLASKLVEAGIFKMLDGAAIYGPNPSTSAFVLFKFAVPLRTESEIPAWRPKLVN